MKKEKNITKKEKKRLVECGERLKECREAKNLTQNELADLINVVPQQISNYETGRRSFKSNAVELSSVLGVRAEYLLCMTQYKTQYDEFSAVCNNIFDTDDLLLQFLRTQGHQISFGKNTSAATPEEIVQLSEKEKVVIDGIEIDLIDFQHMLDDIKDQIDFIMGKAYKYQERRINCIAVDNAYQAELRESKARTKIEDMISKGECTQTPEGVFLEADDFFSI